MAKSDHDMITEIHSVLFGSNGYDGLCKNFNDHCETNGKQYDEFRKFRLIIIGVVCFLVGSGVIGFSVVEILKLLG